MHTAAGCCHLHGLGLALVGFHMNPDYDLLLKKQMTGA
jgi:hypothetical protein